MYLDYFGLKKQPFGITPDTSLFFSGAERGEILQAILYALNAGEGIVKVVGEVGSGKTMLSRMLAKKAPNNAVFVFLLNPNIQAEQVLYAIAYDLGLKVDPEKQSIQLLHLLQKRLLELYKEGRKVVLLIDEAQQMPLETLEEIRLLSNLETETEKLLQIILFGQPELDVHVDSPSVRQLRERITYSFYLSPLDWKMTDKYLRFRLEKAGHQGRAIFDKKAIKRLTKYAGGTLRRLNVLADKSLLAAFLQKSPVVETKHVKLALKDNLKGHTPPQAWHFAVLTVFFAACVFPAAYFLMPLNNQGLFAETVLPVNDTTIVNDTLKNLAHNLNQDGNQDDVDEKNEKVNQLGLSTNLVQSRLSAFNAWVKTTNSVYTIRLMTETSGSAQRVEHYLHSAVLQQAENKFYVSKTPNNIYIVYYGEFGNYYQAKVALSNLSPEMLKYKPYIVNVKK
jgi:MSHA biogenesis protein MshM